MLGDLGWRWDADVFDELCGGCCLSDTKQCTAYKHPAALRDVDPEDEADVDGLDSCRWKTASGNQSRDVWNVGVEKKYYDAAESHLLQGKFRARGTVFSRIEDEASRLWRAGGAIIMILVTTLKYTKGRNQKFKSISIITCN